MPLYEYACKKCGSVSEHLVGVGAGTDGAADAVTCHNCGSEDLERLISVVSINRGAEPATCCGGHVRGECNGTCEHHQN